MACVTVTKRLDTLKDVKLRYKKNAYPVPRNKDLPPLYFIGLFVGVRGSGKTQAAVQLMKKYEQSGIASVYDPDEDVAQRVIIFSPTVDANPVFNALKHLDATVDVHDNYKDHMLKAVEEDIKSQVEQTKAYQEKMQVYRKFLKCRDINELSPKELLLLHLMDFEEPAKPKYPYGCVNFIVLDDLLGTEAFKSTGRSVLTTLCLKSRHVACNVLIMSQNMKAIPKSIRNNVSIWVIFRFASGKVLEDLYEAFSNMCTFREFLRYFEYATEKKHDALVVFLDNRDDSEKIRRNFCEILSLHHK